MNLIVTILKYIAFGIGLFLLAGVFITREDPGQDNTFISLLAIGMFLIALFIQGEQKNRVK